MKKGGRLFGISLGIFACCRAFAADPIVIGGKIFTESYVLGEIAAQSIEASSQVPVTRKLGMGSTGILFEALKSGAIDVYPDYSGTLAEAILKRPELKSLDEIRQALSGLGLTISGSLGFNDTYALAVKEEFAKQHDLHSIGDLIPIESGVRAGFSYEFMDRKDGYPGLVESYHLSFNAQKISRMEHSLSYQAIDQNAIDLIDVYSTDAKIKKLRLQLLKDDHNYFPVYQAVWVARKSFVEKHPREWQTLLGLEGRISEEAMLDMNAQADIQKIAFDKIAARFLGAEAPASKGWLREVARRTKEHLWLVGVSLLFSVLVGIPLGVTAVRFHAAGQAILLSSAVVQTVPSLALLCFLIPVFGVGNKPALAALCLYSLLPVVLNTFTGIRAVNPVHLENARAFGLNRRQVLFRVVLPLASPTLLAGIKTATIVSIGTATLAALVGAGGYGAPIVSGLALNDIRTILTGAIPAALMALVAHAVFELLGLVLIPAGLRRRP
ncbi:MAG TPA: glycine betaine ABC transporter substrate-binding protein [Steroidobacteraceae bacterium]|jgi:osmoprotectant transport system permease protein|nr:glycine betaine ABC transporter substrate-binding protein [Steroidobacteraceae bacterium]